MWHLHPLNCFCQRPDYPVDKELADAGHISPTKPSPVPAWCPITCVFQLHHPNMRPQHLSSALFPELSLLSPFYLFSALKAQNLSMGLVSLPAEKPFKIYPNSSSWPTRAMFYLVLGLSLHPLPTCSLLPTDQPSYSISHVANPCFSQTFQGDSLCLEWLLPFSTRSQCKCFCPANLSMNTLPSK